MISILATPDSKYSSTYGSALSGVVQSEIRTASVAPLTALISFVATLFRNCSVNVLADTEPYRVVKSINVLKREIVYKGVEYFFVLLSACQFESFVIDDFFVLFLANLNGILCALAFE